MLALVLRLGHTKQTIPHKDRVRGNAPLTAERRNPTPTRTEEEKSESRDETAKWINFTPSSFPPRV